MGVIFSAIFHFFSLKYLPPMPVEDYSVKIFCHKFGTLLPHISLQRDPCLVDKFRNLYENSSVSCEVSCNFVASELVTLDPSKAEDDGANILVPVAAWSHCSKPEDTFNCSFHCPQQIGRSYFTNKSSLLLCYCFHFRLINLSGVSSSSPQYYDYQYWLYVWVITMASISFGCGCTFQVR